ncbi:hypothetical protein M2352_004328 [Azospirillum fermentarium]|uniref:transposase domain-containing protein n=1 Tax=Azospirillum fermentarium TaxID=1233114 RepID=UPI002225DB3C|nr:transposase domain-containing protein [Azospirillum fermentarium]MCW2248668.1 hypothetical protein [Azospirillum fermentarium]
MKEWHSAAELAALSLPGLPTTDRAIQLRALRENWRFRKRQGRGGGREYHISVLPTAAQIRLTLLDTARVKTAKPPPLPSDALWRWFDGLSEEKKARARRCAGILDAVVVLQRSGVPKDEAVATVACRHGVGTSSVYHWFSRVAGRDRADWLPALAPRHAGRTAIRACPQEAWDLFRADYLSPAAPAFSECYSRVQRAAAAHGWPLPSERAMLRRLLDCVHPAVAALCRTGMVKTSPGHPAQEHDPSGFHMLEAAYGHGHGWNLWVEWPDGAVCRPYMVAFLDLSSGVILSYRVDTAASARAVRLALGDLAEIRGIPKVCWFGGGAGFASAWLTGGAPGRYRLRIRDEEPLSTLDGLGVGVHWAAPGDGGAAPAERAFRHVTSGVARHPALQGAGAGGGSAGEAEGRPRRVVALDDFLSVLVSEIGAHNSRIGRMMEKHGGRDVHGGCAQAPAVRAGGELRRLWLPAAEGVMVNSRDGTIRLSGNRYWANFLSLHLGETVAVRFDPDFLHDGLHVYHRDGTYLGHTPVIEAPGFGDAETALDYARARRAWLRTGLPVAGTSPRTASVTL